MSRELTAQEQALLARVLTGEVSPEDPRFEELLERTPELRSELEQLGTTRDVLAALAAEGPEVVARVQGQVQAGDHELVEAAVRTARGATAAAPPANPHASLWWAPLAAAALLLGLSLWFRPSEPSSMDFPRGRLHTDQIRHPVGDTHDLSRFELLCEVPPPTQVLFLVYDAEGDREIARAQVRGNTWKPSPQQQATMATEGRFVWEFSFKDPVSNRVISGRAAVRWKERSD